MKRISVSTEHTIDIAYEDNGKGFKWYGKMDGKTMTTGFESGDSAWHALFYVLNRDYPDWQLLN